MTKFAGKTGEIVIWDEASTVSVKQYRAVKLKIGDNYRPLLPGTERYLRAKSLCRLNVAHVPHPNPRGVLR